ncbi:MAG: hypothetical protein NTY74_13625 [Ignavibacteriae bacterium]|nr:hypothetical protein [Ignavibacteriota bacterium]
MEYKKYSKEELELILELDFTKFLKLSAYHKENNSDYFNSVIVPFYMEQKKLGNIPDYNSSNTKENETINKSQQFDDKKANIKGIQSNIKFHNAVELENIAISDENRFKILMTYYYENDYEFFEKTVLPIIKKTKSKNTNESNIDYFSIPGNSTSDHVKNDLSEPIKYLNEYKPNNRINHKPRQNISKKIIMISISASIIIVASLVYYFAIYNTNYSQAIRNLKNKEYSIALVKLGIIDTTSLQFQKHKSKYFYAQGGSFLELNKIREAYFSLMKVDSNDEFFSDAKELILKIDTDPKLIYQKALDHLSFEEYNLALIDLKKIKSNDNNFTQSQSKLAFINGVLEYNNSNYENANTFFQQVNKSDEYYYKIVELQPQIDEYLRAKADKETNLYFAKFLLRTADEIQDEFQLMSQRNTYDYTKLTYLPRLISLRSSINGYTYDAKNKNKDLIEFKKMILSWVNSYIKYGEYIGDYGYKSNYQPQSMWNNYGYIINSEKENGLNLHQKIIKKCKTIKSSFDIN